MNQVVITITSDWGNRDFHRAAVEGSLVRKIPECRIMAISHLVKAFDIYEASFLLRNAWYLYPEGSIHIIAVKGEASIDTPHVLIKYKKHYFIGADNGIFALIFDEKPETIIAIDIHQESSIFSFPTKDVFVPIAAHIASGKDISELGQKQSQIKESYPFKPTVEENLIKGMVIHIDNYDNVICNITESTFLKLSKGKRYSIKARNESVNRIQKAYGDVPEGEMLALFGSSGLLEIAINEGSAKDLLGLRIKDIIRIEFE